MSGVIAAVDLSVVLSAIEDCIVKIREVNTVFCLFQDILFFFALLHLIQNVASKK